MAHVVAYRPDLDGSGPRVLLEGAPQEPLPKFVCRLLSSVAGPGELLTGDIYVGMMDSTGQPGPASLVLSLHPQKGVEGG